MAFPDEPRGAETPSGETVPETHDPETHKPETDKPEINKEDTNDAAGHRDGPSAPDHAETPQQVHGEVITDSFESQYDPDAYGSDWSYSGQTQAVTVTPPPAAPPPPEPATAKPTTAMRRKKGWLA